MENAIKTPFEECLDDGLIDVESAIYIGGTEEERRSFFPAITGVTTSGQICYSFWKLAKCFEDAGMDSEQAVEHINYNVLRSLDYLPAEKRPIIVFEVVSSGEPQ